MAEWAPADIQASTAHMGAIHEELTARGELIGAEGLSGPDAAKIVTHDGVGPPVVTDGPFPESKEFLAGYWFIDVVSEERAIEIAARTSAAPGAGGKPGDGRPGTGTVTRVEEGSQRRRLLGRSPVDTATSTTQRTPSRRRCWRR